MIYLFSFVFLTLPSLLPTTVAYNTSTGWISPTNYTDDQKAPKTTYIDSNGFPWHPDVNGSAGWQYFPCDNPISPTNPPLETVTSAYCAVQNNFKIPASAIITGVEVIVKNQVEPNCIFVSYESIFLESAPAPVNNTNITFSPTNYGYQNGSFPNNNQTNTVDKGGVTDLWGWTTATLTPSLVNTQTFGPCVQFYIKTNTCPQVCRIHQISYETNIYYNMTCPAVANFSNAAWTMPVDTDQNYTGNCLSGYQPNPQLPVRYCSSDAVPVWGPILSGACTDIDECAEGLDNCSPNANCINTPGSYYCTCKNGFSGNGTSCTDINECAVGGNNTCNPTLANCTNTLGSYYCTCIPGYSGDGRVCNDVNECAVGGNNTCAPTAALCTNTNGSYYCTCNSGYSGNGTICNDVDECANGNNTCDKTLATCNNTIGSYTCTCNRGYTGNGTVCTDVDECASAADNNCSIYALCNNTVGSFFCTCNKGFIGNGTTCTDIDECTNSSANNCAPLLSLCTNTVGSFNCSCNAGYLGDGISCTGRPCDTKLATGLPQGALNQDCPSQLLFPNSCNLLCEPGTSLSSGDLNLSCTADGSTLTTAVCTDCKANTFWSDGACVPCDPAATSPSHALECTCNQGYTGNGDLCLKNPAPAANDSAPVTPAGELVLQVVLRLNTAMPTDQTQFSTEFKQDIDTALNTTDGVTVTSIEPSDNGTILVTFQLHKDSQDNRSLTDLAVDLKKQLDDPSSPLFHGKTTKNADPHYYYVSLVFIVYQFFSRLSLIVLLCILIVIPCGIILFYLIMRKVYPRAKNRLIFSLCVNVVNLVFNIWFILFLANTKVFQPFLLPLYYVALAGLVVPFTLNLSLSTFLLSKEYKLNENFQAWATSHYFTFFIVWCFSSLSTQNNELFRSQLFGCQALSAPVTRTSSRRFKFWGIISIVLGDIVLLCTQVITAAHLGNLRTNASIAFIFTLCSIIWGFVRRGVRVLKYRIEEQSKFSQTENSRNSRHGSTLELEEISKNEPNRGTSSSYSLPSTPAASNGKRLWNPTLSISKEDLNSNGVLARQASFLRDRSELSIKSLPHSPPAQNSPSHSPTITPVGESGWQSEPPLVNEPSVDVTPLSSPTHRTSTNGTEPTAFEQEELLLEKDTRGDTLERSRSGRSTSEGSRSTSEGVHVVRSASVLQEA